MSKKQVIEQPTVGGVLLFGLGMLLALPVLITFVMVSVGVSIQLAHSILDFLF